MSKIKGFTLFTALVGFIVIGIGVLSIQHMFNSEQNYQGLLNSLLTQQEMDSSIHIIKLDAISAFDVIYRTQFHTFYKASDSGIAIDVTRDWESFKNGYIEEIFGIDPRDFENEETNGDKDNYNKVSGYLTNKLLTLLTGYRGSYKGGKYIYTIYDYHYQSTVSETKRDFFAENPPLTGTHLANSINESTHINNFLTFLGCQGNSCNRGSFYTNFNFVGIPYNNYINLQRILILNTIDKSQIDDAILPYSKLGLFTPMRIFGALHLAHTEIDNISTGDLSNEYGDEFPECKDITSLDQLKTNETNFDSLTSTLHINEKENDFNYTITNSNIRKNNEYPTEIMIVKIFNQDLSLYQKYKASSVNITIDITDEDVFENIGRMPMKYKFTGTKKINDYDKPKLTYCYCEHKSGASGEEPFNCSENKAKFNENDEQSVKEKIKEALGNSGLDEKDLDAKVNEIFNQG